MTYETKISALEAQATAAAAGLEALQIRRVELDKSIEAAERYGASDAFANFVASGDVATKAKSATELAAERRRVTDMIAAGEAEVAALQRRATVMKRDARAAEIAAMTMPDAVEFARSSLAALDAAAAAVDLDQIVAELDKLDRAIPNAQAEMARAAYEFDHFSRRSRGAVQSDKVTTTLAELAATRDAAERGLRTLVDRKAACRARHERVRTDLQDRLAAAFAHVARLASAEAEKAAKYAADVGVFARSIANPRTEAVLPAPLTLRLPDEQSVAQLHELARPILAVALRD